MTAWTTSIATPLTATLTTAATPHDYNTTATRCLPGDRYQQ
jgi:hypothetical protein